ncbi:MAG: hypothetical protein E7361_01740 [Clostridiales bacterium]|nr:hypothetical protein [Clostridiales bacterium]
MLKTKKLRIINIAKVLGIIIILSLLFVNPKTNMSSFYDGIILWARFVMPALFPILFVSSLLNASGVVQNIGKYMTPITKKLFNCGGISGYIYAISMLSGYPVGAKVTAELYEKNLITRSEATRIASFTSTSGPLFIIGTVGVGMFNSARVGIIVLVSHLLGALFNGIIFRKLYSSKKQSKVYINITTPSNNILEDCMLSSIKSILIIGGYIALSYMLIALADSYNIFYPITHLLNQCFGINPDISASMMQGMIEMTNGIQRLSMLNLNENLQIILSTFLISFGGISIFLQAYTYLAKSQIKIKIYAIEKILHTIISVIVCSILITIF